MEILTIVPLKAYNQCNSRGKKVVDVEWRFLILERSVLTVLAYIPILLPGCWTHRTTRKLNETQQVAQDNQASRDIYCQHISSHGHGELI
jgi:hypothetical protein